MTFDRKSNDVKTLSVHSIFLGKIVFVDTQVLSEIIVTAETFVAVWVWASVSYIGEEI